MKYERAQRSKDMGTGSIDIYRYNGTFAVLVRNTSGAVEAFKCKSAQVALKLVKWFQGLFCKVAATCQDRYLELLLTVN